MSVEGKGVVSVEGKGMVNVEGKGVVRQRFVTPTNNARHTITLTNTPDTNIRD